MCYTLFRHVAATTACRNQDFQQDGISATFCPIFFFIISPNSVFFNLSQGWKFKILPALNCVPPYQGEGWKIGVSFRPQSKNLQGLLEEWASCFLLPGSRFVTKACRILVFGRSLHWIAFRYDRPLHLKTRQGGDFQKEEQPLFLSLHKHLIRKGKKKGRISIFGKR